MIEHDLHNGRYCELNGLAAAADVAARERTGLPAAADVDARRAGVGPCKEIER